MSDILDKVISSADFKEKTAISWTEIVNSLLALIKAREAEILRLRSGLYDNKEHTLEEIGRKMNLTRERVRQLEKNAKDDIKAHKNFDGIMAPAKNAVERALNEHGGLSTKERILQTVLINYEIEDNKKFLQFLIDNFIDEVQDVKNNQFGEGWHLNEQYLNLAAEVLDQIKILIETKNNLVQEDELLENFQKTDFYINNQDKFLPFLSKNSNDLRKVLTSYLDLSHEFGKTPFKQWGKADWRTVTPRRINDKIYSILDWYKQPMHFRDIADKINAAKFDKKMAHSATIHNDLIADERFVLIGRGVYALKDWGYKSGVVADLIEKIIKDAEQPLNKEEIIAEILKQRDVKANTVLLALNKDGRFEKTITGGYKLKI